MLRIYDKAACRCKVWPDIYTCNSIKLILNKLKPRCMNKFLTGLAIGIAIGCLIAPDKGTETRRRLSSKGKELKDQFNDFVDSWAEKIDSLRGETEDFMDE